MPSYSAILRGPKLPDKCYLTLVTSACFLVGKTLDGGSIRTPPPFMDTEWSDKKI